MARRRKKTNPRKRKKLIATTRMKAAARRSAARAAKGAAIRRASAKPAAGKAAKKAPVRFTLHGMFMSLPSCKVGLMLSMSGAKWDYRHIDLKAGKQRTPEFQAKNRFGQVPVLQHGDQFIAQSNAILWYLAETLGKFAGRSEDERLRILEWLNWDQDLMASGVGISRFLATVAPQTPPEVKEFIRKRGERALGMLDRHLGASKFLVGTAPTIADIAVFPWVATAEEGGFMVANYPNLHAWAERMLRLPGSGHPYTIMPKEDRVAG